MTTGREDEDLISDLHVHVIYMDIGHTCIFGNENPQANYPLPGE